MSYLNGNRNSGYADYGSVLWCVSSTLVSDRHVELNSFCQVKLVKRVGEVRRHWTLCSDSGVEVRQNKSKGYWFLKHSLSQTAYSLLPLETLLSILHDLPSQSSSFWHAALLAVPQGIVNTLFIRKKKQNKTSLSPPVVTLCTIVRHFRGKQFRVRPFLPFPMCLDMWYAQFNQLIHWKQCL